MPVILVIGGLAVLPLVITSFVDLNKETRDLINVLGQFTALVFGTNFVLRQGQEAFGGRGRTAELRKKVDRLNQTAGQDTSIVDDKRRVRELRAASLQAERVQKDAIKRESENTTE